MILGRDVLTAVGLDLKFSKNIVIGGKGPYEGCSSPTVDVRSYDFKTLTEKIFEPEESFINAYVENAWNPRD